MPPPECRSLAKRSVPEVMWPLAEMAHPVWVPRSRARTFTSTSSFWARLDRRGGFRLACSLWLAPGLCGVVRALVVPRLL